MSEMKPDEAMEAAMAFMPTVRHRKAIQRYALAELLGAWGRGTGADPYKGLRERIAELEAEVGE